MAATEEKVLPVARAKTGVATHFALPHKVLLLSATMLFMRVAENFYVCRCPGKMSGFIVQRLCQCSTSA